MKQITELLQKGVIANHFPGAQYAIIYRDGSIDTDFVGFKQTTPDNIQNNGTEIYDCASLTKVISTTTMIFKLIEEGLLSLETKISDILPRFMHNEINISDCLTHSSGLPADIPKAFTLKHRKDVEDRIYDFDLIYPTGSKIIYSDIGFILLGWIIETLTNKTLDEYAKAVIFQPLQMNDTSYVPDQQRCAPTEWREDEVYHGLLQGLVHDEKSFAMNGQSGHAGLFSTATDIAKFVYSILRNDGKILQPKTVDLLFPLRHEYTNPMHTRLVRAYGWDKPTRGGTAGDNVSFEDTIVHTGFTGCNMWMDRSKGIGFVMLSNAVHPKRSCNQIISYRNKIGNIIIPSKEGEK